MPKKKKKFLGNDKANQQTFSLVARSRKDLHEGDATTGQNVLVAMTTVDEGEGEEDLSKFGIYYDDDYDYRQHLRTLDEFYDNTLIKDDIPVRKIRLPAAVFADEPADNLHDDFNDEEDEGDCLAAGILDPDVEAALADDAEATDDLEDDFITLAGQMDPASSEAANDERVRDYQANKSAVWSRFFDHTEEENEEDEDMEEIKEDKMPAIPLTKGGRPLTAQEQLLEKQFAKMYEEFKRDGEELETGSRMTGTTGVSESLAYLITRDQAMFSANNIKPDSLTAVNESAENCEEGGRDDGVALKDKILALIPEDEDCGEEDPVDWWSKMDRREKIDYDITSVRSSVISENIPRVMQIPGQPKSRSRVPSSVEAMDVQSISDDEESVGRLFIPGRMPEETNEERRARKKAVKEAQRVRRVEKKLNRAAFHAVKGEPVTIKAMKLT